MLQLPHSSPKDLRRVTDAFETADWAELEVLTSGTGQLSQSALSECAQRAGRLGVFPDEEFPEDREREYDEDPRPEDKAYRFAEDVWAVLRSRSTKLGA